MEITPHATVGVRPFIAVPHDGHGADGLEPDLDLRVVAAEELFDAG
ncbi:hypothetical protein [Streptomyces sp. NPDC001744]